MRGWRMARSRCGSASLPFELAFHPEVLREWRKLTPSSEMDQLRRENARLIGLLEAHGIAWRFSEPAPDWRDDARAFMRSCRQLAVPAALEISRSGEGAHAWVFFEEAVSAQEARQLQLSSYDRLFPNQNTLPSSWMTT